MKKWYQGQRIYIRKDIIKDHNLRMSYLEDALKRGFYQTMENSGMGYMIKKDKNNS